MKHYEGYGVWELEGHEDQDGDGGNHWWRKIHEIYGFLLKRSEQ